MKVDLHLHSSFSDGSFSPKELIEKCTQNKIQYASLTDHDTMSGVKEFLDGCKTAGINAVSGVELSTMGKRKEVHVLGYNIDPENPKFLKELEKIQEMREKRNLEIIAKLKKCKVFINKPESEKGEVVGRLHIAKAIKTAGYITNENEAFDKWLAFGKPAFVSNGRIDTEHAIKIIKSCGGVAVLAHPYLISGSFENVLKYVLELKEVGLDGVETFYANQNKFQQSQMRDFAERHGLVQTCGSDFHGSGRIIQVGDCDGESVSNEDLIKLGFKA